MQDQNQLQSVADKYKDAEVVDQGAAPAAPASPGEAPSNPQSAGPASDVMADTDPDSILQSVADRYKGYDVEDVEESYSNDLADAGAQVLRQGKQTPVTAERDEDSGGIIDWIGDVGRSTIIGTLADPIAGLVLSYQFRDKGVTYKQAVETIREGRERRGGISTSASVAGALLGGGLLAKGLKQSAQWGATKSGLARSAMQYAQGDKILNRVVSAAATGAAAGAVEEGIRTSLEEAVDVSIGEAFDVERVADNVVLGSFLGAVATPALQEGLNGMAAFTSLVKRMTGNTNQQSYDAARRIIQAFAKEGEDLDVAAGRFQEKVQAFRMSEKRMPTAAEVMKQEQVGDVAEVIRLHVGLDGRARRLSEKGVERALKSYDQKVTMGNTFADPEMIDAQMEDVFESVVGRNANTLVSVDETTMAQLMRQRDTIRGMAKHNEGAQSMSRILEAKAMKDEITRSVQRAKDAGDSARGRLEVAKLGKQIAELIDEQMQAGGADMTELAELRNLKNMRDALLKYEDATVGVKNAKYKLSDIQGNLDRITMDLDAFETNGLKITLSDANDIRKAAGRYFKTAVNTDGLAADAMKALRDTVTPIGKAEIPEYANVVKRWNLESIRSEAQATGIEAARGTLDTQALITRLEKGRLPGQMRVSGADQKEAIQWGASEGARRQIQNEVRGTAQEGVRSADRMASNPNAQRNMAQLLGEADSKEITRAAKSVMDSYESFKALAGPVSQSTLAEETKFASDVLTGAAFGNLGGAGRAALMNRVLARFKIPRGTAEKLVDMLGDPDQIQPALNFMQKKKIRVGPLFSSVQAYLSEPVGND